MGQRYRKRPIFGGKLPRDLNSEKAEQGIEIEPDKERRQEKEKLKKTIVN